ELLAPQLDAARIALEIETVTDRPIVVDPAQLKQVLINIIQNAAAMSVGSGTVILRAVQDRLVLDGRLRDVTIFEVEDNGRGIPTDVQKRLFDPFFTTKQSGTGLG